MASVTVPTYQGLTPADFVRRRVAARNRTFPFNVPDRLTFYRARNAIYHLVRALVARTPGLTVLAPDYNSGNEILALRAAGARLRYCPIDRQMRMDPATVDRLCAEQRPDLLYVIHYVGWAQPMTELMAIARRHGMLVIEDCALSLLSESHGTPLGTFGDWAVFCLYKTLPLPNGAVLVQNAERLTGLDRVATRSAGSPAVLGKAAELVVQRIRGRSSAIGSALHLVKRGMGRVANALDIDRPNIGDIGFDLEDVDLAISPLARRLLERLDFAAIHQRRRENYAQLDAQLAPSVQRVFAGLPDGVCPLFLPIVVPDKHAAAVALQHAGVNALEFWNESSDSGAEMGPDARWLRDHVLELPIHQDLTPHQITHMAQQVSILNRRVAA